MLSLVVLEFFVCWTPIYAIDTWKTFHYESARLHINNTTLSFIRVIAYMSASCNPITYCFMNKQFRQSFFMILGCCQNRHKRQYSTRSSIVSSTRLNGTRLSTCIIKQSQRGSRSNIGDLTSSENQV